MFYPGDSHFASIISNPATKPSDCHLLSIILNFTEQSSAACAKLISTAAESLDKIVKIVFFVSIPYIRKYPLIKVLIIDISLENSIRA
jgi:hypothetical protein